MRSKSDTVPSLGLYRATLRVMSPNIRSQCCANRWRRSYRNPLVPRFLLIQQRFHFPLLHSQMIPLIRHQRPPSTTVLHLLSWTMLSAARGHKVCRTGCTLNPALNSSSIASCPPHVTLVLHLG